MPVALITGGASWFSREAASLLLEAGWDVVLGDINQSNLEEVQSALGHPERVSASLLDVTNLEAARAIASDIVVKYGSIDALVNVAGGTNYLQMKRLPFHETDPENWDKILRPNIHGVLNCCHAVLPYMIEARRGGIVTLSSGMGFRGQPRMALYSAAKHAVIGLTQAIAQEVGPYGIRANCVAPGSAESRWMPNLEPNSETERVPLLGARVSARDIANAIVFLLSDKASHITGSCLDISGGTALH